ncbi:MAG: hypothetical protein J6Z23_06200 [Lachnospiraceae bacterium]|nr:hypothetical protein [Lachnospiraceae bacterium]
MKKDKKQKNVTKYVVLALVFLLILVVAMTIAIVRQVISDEEYTGMSAATLPMLRITYLDGYQTDLHGYAREMEITAMRDTVVPVTADRVLNVTLLPYGNRIRKLEYEVRSLDGGSYLDGGTVTEFQTSQDGIPLRLTFSDLLVSGTEYQLVIRVSEDERETRFYTRFLYARTQYTAELLKFVNAFSDATYHPEQADLIVNYIQPDDSVSDADYYYANLHSKYAVLTYANLDVERLPGQTFRITELEPTQASVTVTYSIRMKLAEGWRTCTVTEFFCVRYRSGNIYLLDYFRKITEDFEARLSTREKGRILLGIGPGDAQVATSRNGVYTAFINGRELWLYNTKTNAMTQVFTFSDPADTSPRSGYTHHNMQIVKISDAGEIDYMVYGYMNRGAYEGEVGICFYRYSTENNGTTGLFFMPVTQSEQMLMMDLGTLAYVNTQDVCYLRYGDGIYSIDLKSGESVEVSIRAYPGTYAMNALGNVVAWQEGEDLNYPERLVILNMDSQTTAVVSAEDGAYVKILNFIGDDIIYGFGRRSDSVIVANVDMQQLLNRVVIASTDEGLKIQQEYPADGFHILDVSVLSTRVEIARGVKREDGTIELIDPDVLLLTQDISRTAEKSKVLSRTTNPGKKEYYIQISSTTNIDSQFAETVPRFEIRKKVPEIHLLHNQTGVYYVYGYGSLLYVESSINRAISEAYEVFGVVIDESMNTLWTRGTRDLVKNLSIQAYVADASDDALAAALKILCAQEGIQLPRLGEDLEAGKSPLVIIDAALGKGSAVNLYGCTLLETLYYIHRGHPVIAVTGDREAKVIVGYTIDTVSVYDPETGETNVMTNRDAENYFGSHGDVFISYQ